MLTGDQARIALGVVRLTMGGSALLAPKVMARRFGVDAEANPAALYILRLFGVRTVLLGADLLFMSEDRRRQALQVAVFIHAADALAAVIAGVRGHLPRRAALTAAVISTANTGLAIIARSQRHGRDQP
jgi:hypothetical protein